MDLLTNLSKVKKMPIVLHSFAPFAESFVPKCKPKERVKAPASLRSLYSEAYCKLSPQELSMIVEKDFTNMKLDERDVDYVYNRTLKQSGSILWYETRVGRITASVAHDVLHTDHCNPSNSLIKKICGPAVYGKELQVASVKWGKHMRKWH